MAPLYAALFARLMNIYGIDYIQKNYYNGNYYRTLSLNDIKLGNNVDFIACLGWDPVTGLGSFAQYINIASRTSTSKYFSFDYIYDKYAKDIKSNKKLTVILKEDIELKTKEKTGKLNLI